MNPRVISDIEEALKREFANIYTFHEVTKTETSLKTSYDVFTGTPIARPIVAHFYDETASANQVLYPRIDITFISLLEDRETGRMLSIWEDYGNTIREVIEPNKNAPIVYERITSGSDGINQGSYLKLPTIKYAKVNVGNLVKIVSGPNKGTYLVKALDALNTRLELDSELITDIQEISYNAATYKLYLLNPTELHTIRAGDIFVDANDVEFVIADVRPEHRELYLQAPTTSPSLALGSKIIRNGNVLNNLDSGAVSYVVMDSTKPKLAYSDCNNVYRTEQSLTSTQLTPFNYYYNVEITNKERPVHIAMAERMTETVINRPRRAIKLLLRTEESAESEITDRPQLYYSNVIKVKSAEKFTVNDSVYLLNKTSISENNQIVDIDYQTNEITLRNPVTLDYSFQNEGRIVSNATPRFWTFYLEGEALMGTDFSNQYWRQNYRFKVEGWKDEKRGKTPVNLISKINYTLETPNHIVCDIDIE